MILVGTSAGDEFGWMSDTSEFGIWVDLPIREPEEVN